MRNIPLPNFLTSAPTRRLAVAAESAPGGRCVPKCFPVGLVIIPPRFKVIDKASQQDILL
jgi:hypothetical protein